MAVAQASSSSMHPSIGARVLKKTQRQSPSSTSSRFNNWRPWGSMTLSGIAPLGKTDLYFLWRYCAIVVGVSADVSSANLPHHQKMSAPVTDTVSPHLALMG